MNMPRLDALNLFARVAAHRSFRRAAAETGLSPSSVSERIRALEDEMGLRLLNRTTRSVSPTEAGEVLLARLSGPLSEIAAALDEAGRDDGGVTGRLRINAPLPAAQFSLAPLVAPFLAANPGVRMEVVVDPLFRDVVGEGFDAGVRYGEHLAADMIAVSLGGPQRYALVGSPGLVARAGTPCRPDDLMTLPVIMQAPGGAPGPLPLEFERGGRSVTLRPEGVLTVTDPGVGIRACLDGLGYMGTFREWVEADIRAGRLVSLLEDWLPPFDGPFLYYPSRRHMPPALRAFVDFVKAVRRTRA